MKMCVCDVCRKRDKKLMKATVSYRLTGVLTVDVCNEHLPETKEMAKKGETAFLSWYAAMEGD